MSLTAPPSQSLDFTAILKASQSLSRIIHLDDLRRQVTQVMRQNSGADRCTLLLPDAQGEWQVSAVALPPKRQRAATTIDPTSAIPHQVIEQVQATQTAVVIHPDDRDLRPPDDRDRPPLPQSILCLPIVNHSELLGILYLSHRSASGIFTPGRVLILNFLCAQAAISLSNSRLFQASKQVASDLQQTNAFLEAQRECALDGILVVDQHRQINAFNQQFLDLWRIPTALRTTRDDHAMLGFVVNQVADSEAFLAEVLHLYEHIHESSHCEILLQDDRTIERTSVPVNTADGQHCGRIWYFRDITDRKAAETAIHQKSQELEQALQALQQTQLQMVQSEKMSALGNLVAGVAHEINNPIGCIVGNVGAAQGYINDLLGVLDLYATQFPAPGSAIDAALATIDLAYIREDLPKLIRAMRDGGDRIKSISRSLRTFSRADTDVQQTFNLHEGIDSTVLILRHRLKATDRRPDIQVVTDYGKIPPVECFPGQLNQVFMNILANAIDALDEGNHDRSFTNIQAHPHQITIQTRLESHQVAITIRDNGPGMSESVRTQIFDHLFTTKAVGQGTGLGLAIAQQIIVEKHGGTIHVESTIGQGTAFIIQLPLV
jgi:signal transduction histidine kinase